VPALGKVGTALGEINLMSPQKKSDKIAFHVSNNFLISADLALIASSPVVCYRLQHAMITVCRESLIIYNFVGNPPPLV
jgi:hypothetical protein